jgi:hypothetical protein
MPDPADIMSTKTSIEWTEQTWNPAVGCSKVSPGCAHCYAEVMARRLKAMRVKGYENGFRLTLLPRRLEEPIRRKQPTVYFVNSMSDLFHEEIPDSNSQAPCARWLTMDNNNGTAKSGTEKQRFEVTLPSGRVVKPPAGRYCAFSPHSLELARKRGEPILARMATGFLSSRDTLAKSGMA